MKGLIVTATGTDIGKTMITGAIGAALKMRGLNVGVYKPFASGAVRSGNGQLRSEDAVFLMQAAGLAESLHQEVNEICLEPALTPAVAAKIANQSFDINSVIKNLRRSAEKYDYILVEGVGGLISPLLENYTFTDFMLELGFPAVMVTKPGLGAINYAVLTDFYAKAKGIQLGGVIYNDWDEGKTGILEQSNLEYIQEFTGLPVLGKFPWLASDIAGNRTFLAEAAEQYMDIDSVIAVMGEGRNSALI